MKAKVLKPSSKIHKHLILINDIYGQEKNYFDQLDRCYQHFKNHSF